MGFTKFTKNVLNVSALPDRVQNQANMLKATFDQAGVDIKAALNALISELEASTSASNLGANVSSVTTKTVQAILTAFELEIANRYTKNEIDTLVSGNTNDLVADVDVNLTTGIITVTKKDGAVEKFDTALEKVPAKFEIVESGTSLFLKITNVDGSSTQTNITELMNIYDFSNSNEVAFNVSGTGNEKVVTASIRSNSIGLDKLSLSVVTTLEGYMTSARDSASAAKISETNARNSANTATKAAEKASIAENLAETAIDKAAEAESYAHGGTGTRPGEDTDNAKYYSQIAKQVAGGDFVTPVEMEAYAQKKGTAPSFEGEVLSGEVIEADTLLEMESVLHISGNSEQDSTDNSPSPEYPSEIRSVSGDVEVKVESKNILNIADTNTTLNYNVETEDFTIKNGFSKSSFATIDMTLVANKTYLFEVYLSGKVGNNQTASFNFQKINGGGNAFSKSFTFGSASNYYSYTYTATEDVTCTRLQVYVGTAFTEDVTFKLQVRESTTEEGYYSSKPKTISLPLGDIELRSIPETERDTFERVNGVWNKVGRIASYIATGGDNENWWQQSVSETYGRLMACSVTGEPPAIIENCLCSHALFNGANKGGAWVGIYPSYDKLVLRFQTKAFASGTDFITWLRSNPIQYDYVLATPTYTPITDKALIQALDELEQLILHKGYNRITAVSVNGVKAYIDLEIHPTASVTKVEETESTVDMIVPVVSGEGDVIPKIPRENQITLNPSTGLVKAKRLEIDGNSVATETYVDEQVSTINTTVATKADTTYVETQVATKADVSHTHSASSITAGTLVEGMKCTTPTANEHIANKAYVDNVTGGAFVTGTYVGTATGTSVANQTINIGFTPSAVIVTNISGQMNRDSSGDVYCGGMALSGAPAVNKDGAAIVEIIENGFKVHNSPNAKIAANDSDTTYKYIAFK